MAIQKPGLLRFARNDGVLGIWLILRHLGEFPDHLDGGGNLLFALGYKLLQALKTEAVHVAQVLVDDDKRPAVSTMRPKPS